MHGTNGRKGQLLSQTTALDLDHFVELLTQGVPQVCEFKGLIVVSDSIGVLLPTFIPGSGGHKTILENLAALRHQAQVVFYLEALDGSVIDLAEQNWLAEGLCHEWTGHLELRVGWENLVEPVALATVAQSAPIVSDSSALEKFYFVQDRESFFNPASSSYFSIELSYSLALQKITIGRWLSHFLRSTFGQPTASTPFGVDPNIYFPADTRVSGPARVAILVQPEKPRRLYEILASACQVLTERSPEVEILTYGTNMQFDWGPMHDHLGLLREDECAELYASSDVGICLSGTNPSRIPFEMSAVGLPVVDIFHSSTMFDYDPRRVLLAMPTASSIAEAALCQAAKRSSTLALAAAEPQTSREQESAVFAEAILNGNGFGLEPVHPLIMEPAASNAVATNREWVSSERRKAGLAK